PRSWCAKSLSLGDPCPCFGNQIRSSSNSCLYVGSVAYQLRPRGGRSTSPAGVVISYCWALRNPGAVKGASAQGPRGSSSRLRSVASSFTNRFRLVFQLRGPDGAYTRIVS